MKKILLAVVLVIVVSPGLSQGAADIFFPYVVFPTGSWPEAVAIGDVNGDSRNDVVMTTSQYSDPENDYRLFVFLQNASGQLDLPIKYPAGNGDSVDIGDLNNDGRKDVVVSTYDAIGVFYQNDTGGLAPMVTYPSAHSSLTNSYKVRIGDFNNDGLLDVVSIDWGTQSMAVEIFFQNQGGTLDPPVTYTVDHGGYDDLDVGDVNHDGMTDIIVMSGQSYEYSNLGVLLQQADGSFGPPIYYDLGGNELTSGVAVGDVNGDTWHDVVVTYGGNSPNSKIGVFLQNSYGTLESAVSYGSYDIPEPVVIGDINGDGRQDIITAHGGWDALGVYIQYPDGSLAPEQLYPLPYRNASHYNPHGLAIGDISGDGLQDIVLADYNHGLLVLYAAYPRLALFSPNGGEVIPSGSSFDLRWGAPANAVEFKLLYSLDNGTTWIPIANHLTGTGHSWQVPKPTANKKGCLVKVVAYNDLGRVIGSDKSDSTFTIEVVDMTSPKEGDTLVSGTQPTISWTTYGTSSTVKDAKLYYTKNGGITWIPIGIDSTNSGSYNAWTVPSVASVKSKCRVKVVLRNYNGKTVGSGVSDGWFTIAPP